MANNSVICHFCSVGDRMILNYSGVDEKAYFGPDAVPTTEFFQGDRGLCPRGNYCVKFTNHKKRFSYGWLEGNQRPVSDVISYVKAVLGRTQSDKIAVIISSSLTCEEALTVAEWANSKGIKWLSMNTPEDYASAFLRNDFTFYNLKNSQAVIAIGDVFSLHPTLTRTIHDARTAKRGNFLAVVDNCRTITSRFAWNFLRLSVDKIPQVIRTIAMYLTGKQYSLDNTDVDNDQLQRFCDTIIKAESGTVLYAHGVGHFTQPNRIGYWAKKLAEARGFNFAGLSTGANARAIARILKSYCFSFEETFSAILNGKVDALVCLSCDPIDSFPLLYREISKVDFVAATATMPTPITEVATAVIPANFLFEKKGTVLGIDEKLSELTTPIPAPEYPGEIGLLNALGAQVPERRKVEEVLGNYKFDESEPNEKQAELLSDIWAIGYIPPHHHGDGSLTRRDIWVERNTLANDNVALIGLTLSEKLGIKEGETIAVETSSGESEFTVEIENDQFADVVLVPMHMPNGRSIMRFENGIYSPTPARVRKA